MKVYIELEEVDLLEGAVTNLRDRLLIRLLAHLGCRISEALALTVEDIDFARGTVTIQHLKCRVKLSCPYCSSGLGRSHSFCPGCGACVEKVVARSKEHRRVRTLPLDSDSLAMVKEYVARGGPVVRDGQRLIFGISRNQAWRIVRDSADKAGLGQLVNPETGRVRGVSPHRLRDAFAVMAVQRDDSTDSVRMLQEWLGHASIATTMRYRKVAGQELKAWYDGLWRKEGGGG